MRRAQTVAAQFANFGRHPPSSTKPAPLASSAGMNSLDWRQISSGAKAPSSAFLVNRDQRIKGELRLHPLLTEPLRVIERERQNGDEGVATVPISL